MNLYKHSVLSNTQLKQCFKFQANASLRPTVCFGRNNSFMGNVFLELSWQASLTPMHFRRSYKGFYGKKVFFKIWFYFIHISITYFLIGTVITFGLIQKLRDAKLEHYWYAHVRCANFCVINFEWQFFWCIARWCEKSFTRTYFFESYQGTDWLINRGSQERLIFCFFITAIWNCIGYLVMPLSITTWEIINN